MIAVSRLHISQKKAKSLLFHRLPVDKSLALAVEFHGKAYDSAPCATERFKIFVVCDLPLGSSDAAVIGKLQLNDVDVTLCLHHHVYPARR